MIVRDPTAYEIHFLAIPPPREGKKLHAVVHFLNEAAGSFAQSAGRDAPYRIVQLEDFTEQAIDLLTSMPPIDAAGKGIRELDARTIHDAAMLRTTILHRGSFDLATVKGLDFCATPPSQPDVLPNYLGAFRVLYVETDREAGAKRADAGKALAAAFDWTWLAEAEPVATNLGTMLFGIKPRTPHEQNEAAVLDLIFVGGRDAAEIAEGYTPHPFLLTLPELALCHLKVRNSAANLRHGWLPKLADREKELRDLLPKRGERRRSLLQMLDCNDDITTRQAELIEAVAQVEAELRTMRINRDNFAVACAGPLECVSDKLKRVLIDRWIGAELQAENDLGYIQGTLQLAESHFKSLAASAAADQARQLKRINWWVIFLAGLQVAAGLLSAFLAWKALSAPAPSTPGQAPKADANTR